MFFPPFYAFHFNYLRPQREEKNVSNYDDEIINVNKRVRMIFFFHIKTVQSRASSRRWFFSLPRWDEQNNSQNSSLTQPFLIKYANLLFSHILFSLFCCSKYRFESNYKTLMPFNYSLHFFRIFYIIHSVSFSLFPFNFRLREVSHCDRLAVVGRWVDYEGPAILW